MVLCEYEVFTEKALHENDIIYRDGGHKKAIMSFLGAGSVWEGTFIHIIRTQMVRCSKIHYCELIQLMRLYCCDFCLGVYALFVTDQHYYIAFKQTLDTLGRHAPHLLSQDLLDY